MCMYRFSLFIFGIGVIFIILGVLGYGVAAGEIWVKINSNSLLGFQSLLGKYFDLGPSNSSIYFDIFLPLLQQSILIYVGIILNIISFVIKLITR